MGEKTNQPSQGNNPNQNKNSGKTSSSREETMGDQTRTDKMDESLRGSQPGTNRSGQSGSVGNRGTIDPSSSDSQRQGGYGKDTEQSSQSNKDKNWSTGGSE